MVVIDPVRTRTAREADWHVAPLPGTDAALALGMMQVLHDLWAASNSLGPDARRLPLPALWEGAWLVVTRA